MEWMKLAFLILRKLQAQILTVNLVMMATMMIQSSLQSKLKIKEEEDSAEEKEAKGKGCNQLLH